MDTRDAAIHEAALALYAEGGLNAVTIRALGARSGASTGSIYHRFGDRGGVLSAVLLDCVTAGFAPMRTLIDGDPDAEAGVRGLVEAWLGWVQADPVRARYLYDASVSPDLCEHKGDVLTFKADFFAALEAWILPRVAAGALRPLPIWAWDPVLMGPAHEIARRWLAGAPLALESVTAEISEAVWRAIRGEGSETPSAAQSA